MKKEAVATPDAAPAQKRSKPGEAGEAHAAAAGDDAPEQTKSAHQGLESAARMRC